MSIRELNCFCFRLSAVFENGLYDLFVNEKLADFTKQSNLTQQSAGKSFVVMYFVLIGNSMDL